MVEGEALRGFELLVMVNEYSVVRHGNGGLGEGEACVGAGGCGSLIIIDFHTSL